MKKEKPERIGQGHEMMKRNLDRIRRTVASQLYYVKDREINWSELTLRDLVLSAVEALQGIPAPVVRAAKFIMILGTKMGVAGLIVTPRAAAAVFRKYGILYLCNIIETRQVRLPRFQNPASIQAWD